MIQDRYSLKKPFETTTGLEYEDFTGPQKVWAPTKTYYGEGIVDPVNMASIAERFADELAMQGHTGADDALSAFYYFVCATANFGRRKNKHESSQPLQNQRHKCHYGFKLDLYDIRTLLKGMYSEAESTCNQKAAELLGLCRGVGIPSRYDSGGGHGRVNAWTDKTGWVRLAYPDGFYSEKKTDRIQDSSEFLGDDELAEELSKYFLQL